MASTRSPRSRPRRWMIAGALLLVAAVLAPLVLVMVARTARFQDWLRGQVVARVNAVLDGRLEIGGLGGDPLGRLVLTDVRLTRDGGRVLAIKRAELRYEPASLVLGGALRIRTLTVDGLALRLVERDGRWNLEGLFPSRAGGTFGAVVDRLLVRSGSVKVLGAGGPWRVRNLALEGAGETTPRGKRLALGTLTGEVAGRGVQVESLSGEASFTPDGTVATTGTLRTGGSRLRWDAGAVEASGARRYQGVLAIDRLAASEVRALIRGDLPALDLAGRVRLEGPARDLAVHAKLATRAGDVAFAGAVDLEAEAPAYRLDALFRRLDLARLVGGRLPQTDLQGSARVVATGRDLLAARGDVSVVLAPSTIGPGAVDTLTLDAELTADGVTFTSAATNAAGRASLEGSVDPRTERYDLRAGVEGLDLGALLARPALAGSVSGTATASGRGFAGAEGEATLALAPSRVGGVAMTQATAAVRATPERFTIERLEVTSSAGRLQASGSLARAAGSTPPGRLAWTFVADDVGPLAALAGLENAAGRVALEGTAAGSIAALDVEVEATGHDLALADATAAAGRARLSVTGLDTRRVGDARELPAARAALDATATTVGALERAFERVRLEGTWQRTRGAGEGTAAVALAAEESGGRAQRLRARATVAAGAATVHLEELRLQPDATAWELAGQPTIVLRDDRVAISALVLAAPDGRLHLEGNAGRHGPVDLTLTLDDVDLALAASLLPPEVQGQLNGTARLSGSAADPHLEAQLALADATLGGVRYGPATARLTIAGGRAELDATIAQNGALTRTGALDLRAALPVTFTLAPFAVTPGEELSGSVRATALDLAFLDPLVEEVAEIGGRLDADLALAGSPAAPRATGSFALSGGRARIVRTGVLYDPIDAALRLDGDHAIVERLQVASGKGWLRGEGEATALASAPVLDVRAELSAFPFLANEHGTGAVSGWLWATGSVGAPVVEGALATDHLTITLPEEAVTAVRPPDPTITVVRPVAVEEAAGRVPRGETEAATPAPGFYERAAIRLQVTIPRDAWLRRSDAEIELRGWATLWKKPQQEAQVSGEITAVRGWYSFRGKRFTVVEGKVTLTGQDFDPMLDLTAMHRTRDYEVFVVVGGTVAVPKLRLESDPPLEQSDVLSVLLFGKTADELSGGESDVLREQTVAIASSYAAQGLSQSVAGTIGLDTLSVDSGSGGGDGLGAQVTAGKYVAEDIFVSLSHRFGRESADELRIEYRFRPEWSLETTADTQGRSGIDVIWRRRY